MWGVFINYFIQLVKKVDNTLSTSLPERRDPDVIEKDPVRISAQSILCSLE